jgi:uncharacterized membrane-anchored protein
MKNVRLSIFVVVALAQLAVPAYAVWMRTQTLSHGRLWKFRTAPVDPVDLVRGRYIALRFASEEVPQAERLKPGRWAYAVLKEATDGFAIVDHVSAEPIAGDNVIKVENVGWWESKQRLRFPFNNFWVSEDLAPAAETAYAANSRQQKQNAYVTVRVRNGDAALEDLYIDGQPLKEYLRQRAPP